jgi:hypothetical protein
LGVLHSLLKCDYGAPMDGALTSLPIVPLIRSVLPLTSLGMSVQPIGLDFASIVPLSLTTLNSAAHSLILPNVHHAAMQWKTLPTCYIVLCTPLPVVSFCIIVILMVMSHL